MSSAINSYEANRYIILPMFVLRRLDAVLESTKQDVLNTKKMLDDAGITEQRAALCRAPNTNAGWEKLSILLNFLVPKLPAPKEEDLAKGILESIDTGSRRRQR